MVMIKRMIVDQHHPSRRYRVGFPLLGSLEELEIGLNVFNELDDADFSRYSSPTGEKYRSSSSETGRPAATPLRRGITISPKVKSSLEQIVANGLFTAASIKTARGSAGPI